MAKWLTGRSVAEDGAVRVTLAERNAAHHRGKIVEPTIRETSDVELREVLFGWALS